MTIEAPTDALKTNKQPLKKQQKLWWDPVVKDYRYKWHTGTSVIFVRMYKQMEKSMSFFDTPWKKCQCIQCRLFHLSLLLVLCTLCGYETY